MGNEDDFEDYYADAVDDQQQYEDKNITVFTGEDILSLVLSHPKLEYVDNSHEVSLLVDDELVDLSSLTIVIKTITAFH
jgi:hypothetical protein